MDKVKGKQSLDDEALDQVSGGIELTTLINKDFSGRKKDKSAKPLVYKGEMVHAGGLVYYGGTGNGLTMNNLTVQNTGNQDDEDNFLIPV
ncbi:MAG: hypothetical protein IKS55_06825 [Oscillospiraceae bacterium]|nr:hypothetical protein [Oscillospiraceae bacterium]